MIMSLTTFSIFAQFVLYHSFPRILTILDSKHNSDSQKFHHLYFFSSSSLRYQSRLPLYFFLPTVVVWNFLFYLYMFFVRWFIGVHIFRCMIYSISFIFPSFKICKLIPRDLYISWHLLLFLAKMSKFQILFSQ